MSFNIILYKECQNYGRRISIVILSCFHLLPVKRVTSDTTSVLTAIEQTHDLLKHKSLPFGKAALVIQTVDSGYCTPKFIAPLVESYDNLAIIVRFRHGSKVWQKASQMAQNEPNK